MIQAPGQPAREGRRAGQRRDPPDRLRRAPDDARHRGPGRRRDPERRLNHRQAEGGRPAGGRLPLTCRAPHHHLLDALHGHRLEPLVLVLASTGLRIGEALALRWSDLDLDAPRLQASSHRPAGRWPGRADRAEVTAQPAHLAALAGGGRGAAVVAEGAGSRAAPGRQLVGGRPAVALHHRVRPAGRPAERGRPSSELSPLPGSTCRRASTCSGTPQPLPCSPVARCRCGRSRRSSATARPRSPPTPTGTSWTARRRMRSASSTTCSPGELPPELPPDNSRGPVTVM